MYTPPPLHSVLGTALAEHVSTDPTLVVLTEGASPLSDAVRAVAPDRVRALPVADRAMLGVATGLAWAGKRVVVEVSSTTRLPALVEALTEACRPRTGTGATLVLCVPWGDEVGLLDAPVVDLLAGVPGLTVVAPLDGPATSAALAEALGRTTPTVLLDARRRGGAVSTAPGATVTLAAAGPAVSVAAAAAAVLAEEGILADVVAPATLVPAPMDALVAAMSRTGRLVVVTHEPGLGQRWVSAAVAGAFLSFESPPAVVPPRLDDVLAAARAAVAW